MSVCSQQRGPVRSFLSTSMRRQPEPPAQDDVDDLIHDEGEEVPEAEDVARRYDREAQLRQVARSTPSFGLQAPCLWQCTPWHAGRAGALRCGQLGSCQ